LRSNSVIHGGGSFVHPYQVVREAIEVLSTFKLLTATPAEGNEMINVQRPVVWQAPPPGFYKVNWDVAVDIKRRKMGFWAIIRDYRGQVVATCSRTQGNSIMAEAWGWYGSCNFV
jgi:hypothetical protein